MNTPIYDYVKGYIDKDTVRAHMPGHKGRSLTGRTETVSDRDSFYNIYKYDITEIDGADYLSAPNGIISESEKNAGMLFGCPTFYSAEGSSLCIRAMLFLLKKKTESRGKRPFILAGRNAHSAFVNAAALMDIEVDWIMPLKSESYESCSISASDIEEYINSAAGCLPDALYITSPDYLGNMQDVSKLTEVCHKHGLLLMVDNAHGAYLRFLENSLFPIDLGADVCCSSAHKTLPVLTGGAYLHISSKTDMFFCENVRQALSIFASTSPSYLILQSLDLCNDYLESMAVNEKVFCKMSERVEELKDELKKSGYIFIGDEPVKLTLLFDGKNGNEISDSLAEDGIYVEYHDESHIVLMMSPQNTEEEFKAVEKCLKKIADDKNLFVKARMFSQNDDNIENIRMSKPLKAMSLREAMKASSELVDVKDSIGRVLAGTVLSCPPCVPVYMYGEVIGEDILKYCNGKIRVVSEK